VLFVLIVVVVGVLVAVWAGAALAAQLGPGHEFRAGLAEASQALRALPSNLSDPAATWPSDARQALPGPFLYWASQAVVIVGIILLGWLVWRVSGARGNRTASASSARPTSPAVATCAAWRCPAR